MALVRRGGGVLLRVPRDAGTGGEARGWGEGRLHAGLPAEGGPVVAKGVVSAGTDGRERYSEQTCFITGHDPDIGDELWRRSIIALPGDRNNAWRGDTPP